MRKQEIDSWMVWSVLLAFFTLSWEHGQRVRISSLYCLTALDIYIITDLCFSLPGMVIEVVSQSSAIIAEYVYVVIFSVADITVRLNMSKAKYINREISSMGWNS